MAEFLMACGALFALAALYVGLPMLFCGGLLVANHFARGRTRGRGEAQTQRAVHRPAVVRTEWKFPILDFPIKALPKLDEKLGAFK